MLPIDTLRTVVSAMSGSDAETAGDSHQAAIRSGIRITACAPTILAAHFRVRRGEEPVAPNGDLGHSANFLHMMFGKMPYANDSRALDKDLVLHVERQRLLIRRRTVTSTGADLYSAITAATAALKGPMHGGAADKLIRMVLEIGPPERAKEYVEALDRGEWVMGFGHAVYKTADPRSVCLEPEAKALASRNPRHQLDLWGSTIATAGDS